MPTVSDVDLDFLESPTQNFTGSQLHAGAHSHQTPFLLSIHLILTVYIIISFFLLWLKHKSEIASWLCALYRTY